MKLKEFMQTYSVPNIDYYITTKTSYVFAGTRNDYKKYISVSNQIIQKENETILKKHKSTLASSTGTKIARDEWLKNRIEELENYIENYEPLEERKVLGVERIIYGVKITLEGSETGKFFTKNEFQKEISKYEKVRDKS